MIDYLINSLYKICLIFLISISFRFLLQIYGQNWIKTTSHTATITILPIITFIITTVISGNIALSLGMVGALSIVRFRNPVRSPLELTVYFAAITLGISASVSLKSLFLLAISIYLTTFLLTLLSFSSKIFFKKQFFKSSFSEGNQISTLQVTAKETINTLDSSKLLKSILFTVEGNKEYLLACNDFDTLRKISLEVEKNNLIISYQLNEC